MMIRLLNLFLGILFTLAAPLVLAQGYEPEKSMAEIESSMEENLTWNLQNALSLYYPATKFVIRANVDLKKVVPQRTLPSLPDILLNKELGSLPGLPFVPEKSEEGPYEADDLSLYRFVQKNNYDVRRIRVNVLLDETLTENDRAFIQRYVSITADIDPGRGDQVRIEALNFPAKAEFIPEPLEATMPPEQPLGTEPAPVDKTAMDWRPYIFAAALALLLLAFFLFGLRFVTRKAQGSQEPGQAKFLASASPSVFAEQGPQRLASDDTAEFSRLKSAAIDAIVGTPATAAKVFSQWIDEREQGGIQDVAVALCTVSRPLLDLIAPHIGTEIVFQVQHRMDALGPAELDERAQPVLQKFDEDVRRVALRTRENAEEEDALAFLNQMTDDQLQHLMKPLKHGVKAIVLAQLRPQRAAKLLNRMDAEERNTLLAGMGDIERIPLDVYQHVTRQLATRASELEKMRYVRANGLDSLVKVLDYFDEDAQSSTLSYLQTQNMDLANKVSQRFMTFNQLFNMSEDRIRQVALDVDRELFAKSLVKVEEQEVQKIIAALPEKLGELVEASLETHNDLSDKEVEQARRALMRSVRSKHAQTVT